MTGGVFLGIHLRLHNHAPQHVVIGLAFHQQAADELGATSSVGRAKKEWGSGWESVVAQRAEALTILFAHKPSHQLLLRFNGSLILFS